VLRAGDVVSKVNGLSCSTMTFAEVVRFVANAQRPFVCHFLQTATAPAQPPLMAQAHATAVTAPAPAPPQPVDQRLPAAAAGGVPAVGEFDDMPLGDELGDEGDFNV
jgi:hypothetical protein